MGAARRGRDRDDQLHLGHHRAAQGRAADAPQPVAQRDRLRPARRDQRPRRLPAHAADVPRQRLGDALRHHRHGRQARGAAPGRRHRDPAPDRRARRDADVRGPGRGERGAGGGADLGRRDPRPRPGPDRGGRRSPADPHHRAGDGGAGLAVQPDLRPHRDLADRDGQPDAGGVGRPVHAREGPEARPGRGAGAGGAGQHRPRGRGADVVQPQPRRLLGAARRDRAGAGRATPSTPATAATSTTTATW